MKTVEFDKSVIPEVRVPWVRAQQWAELIPGHMLEELRRCKKIAEIQEIKVEVPEPEPYITQKANWEEIESTGKEYSPARRPEDNPKNLAWEFACNLYNRFKLSAKDALRALCEWSARYYTLPYGKIKQILSNARNTAGPNAPSSLWKTDRWLREKVRRDHTRDMLVRATKALSDHVTDSGWKVSLSEKEKLAARQLSQWAEGRSRCGNSYWWAKYQSPGLEEMPGVETYCKTCHACGSPGCSECALYQTEKEVGQWDWPAAYGIRFPKTLDLWVSRDFGIHELKSLVSKLTKRVSGFPIHERFGAFIPTPEGYRLRIIVPGNFSDSDYSAVVSGWADVCRKYADTLGQAELSEVDMPAEELAVELILMAERELFELVDRGSVCPELGWKWFKAWVGDKPGAKGMNRIWHGPGFRNFRVPELTPNNDPDDMLDDNSGDESFPRTWASLESEVKKGYTFRVFDPYLKQVVYLSPGSERLVKIPSEYTLENGKPLVSQENRTAENPRRRNNPGPAKPAKSVSEPLPDINNHWTTWTPEQIHRKRQELQPHRSIKADPMMDGAQTREVRILESIDHVDGKIIAGLL